MLKNIGASLFMLFYSSGIYSQLPENGSIRDTVISGFQFFTDGVLINGLEEGSYNFWNANKVLWMKGAYQKGTKVGLWYYYDQQGTLYQKGSYSSDSSIILNNISNRSEIIDTVLYKGTTAFDSFDEDGGEDMNWTFVDDEPISHREVKTFVEQKEGLWEYYDKEGQIMYKKIYLKGKVIEYIKVQDFPSGFDDFEGDTTGWNFDVDTLKKN